MFYHSSGHVAYLQCLTSTSSLYSNKFTIFTTAIIMVPVFNSKHPQHLVIFIFIDSVPVGHSETKTCLITYTDQLGTMTSRIWSLP